MAPRSLAHVVRRKHNSCRPQHFAPSHASYCSRSLHLYILQTSWSRFLLFILSIVLLGLLRLRPFEAPVCGAPANHITVTNMSFQSILAATALLAIANAHVTMKSPVPYSVDKIDSGPISKSQYPCKSQNGFTVSTMNPMEAGQKQTMKLDGSAVHGGGSCQLSVTLDTKPSTESVFKVIKSIEGGCPGTEGKARDYEFELPTSIPNGKATFAWTWFSKMSGTPELYMNCAPIEVSGGASNKTAFEALPDILVANIDDTCKSETNFAVAYPNPGSVVQKGTTNDAKPPVGAGCGSPSGTRPTKPSGSSGVEPPAAPTSVASPSPPSGQYSTSAAPPTAPSAPPTQPGDGYGPGSSSAGPVAPPQGTSTRTTLVTVTGKPTRPCSGKPTMPGATGVPGPTGTGSPAPPAPSSDGDSSGTCTTDGAVVCKGSTQFGLCNKGKVVWQAVAAGTTCSNGAIAKRGYNGRIARPRVNSKQG